MLKINVCLSVQSVVLVDYGSGDCSVLKYAREVLGRAQFMYTTIKVTSNGNGSFDALVFYR